MTRNEARSLVARPAGRRLRSGRLLLVQLVLVLAIALSYALVVTRGGVAQIVTGGSTPPAATPVANSRGPSGQPSGEHP
ncbi:MAG TPA: hypothetical protein VFI28_01250 [Candidatus Limnocylindrales bacterium]|nr:hypothetical protein [Candidatus Limnocylindrales bacterium]